MNKPLAYILLSMSLDNVTLATPESEAIREAMSLLWAQLLKEDQEMIMRVLSKRIS